MGRHALVLYLVLAFSISWTAISVVVAPSGIPHRGGQVGRLVPFVYLAMLAGPVCASLAMTALAGGRGALRELWARFVTWRVAPRWYAIALLTAPALLLLVLLPLSAAWPSFTPAIATRADRGPLLAMSLVGGLGAGFFEELGWTGYATPRMLERSSPLRAGLLLGLVWAAWHGLADYWGGAEAYGSLWPAHFLLWVVCSRRIASS